VRHYIATFLVAYNRYETSYIKAISWGKALEAALTYTSGTTWTLVKLERSLDKEVEV
jgi:hypothetical protein